MGFYYGSSQPPPGDERGSLKEAMAITLMVFRMLAIPLAVLLGGVGYIVLLFYLFSTSAIAGYSGLGVVVIVVAAIWAWEKTHPPKLKE
jgi:hypothetical protein